MDDPDPTLGRRWLARNLAWSATLEQWRQVAAAGSMSAALDEPDTQAVSGPALGGAAHRPPSRSPRLSTWSSPSGVSRSAGLARPDDWNVVTMTGP